MAVAAVQSRQVTAYDTPPRIPLMCSGHRTGLALLVVAVNELDEDVTVPYHLQLSVVDDPRAKAAGSVEDPPYTMGSYKILCGSCGRPTSQRAIRLLRAALECMTKAGSADGPAYRIRIT